MLYKNKTLLIIITVTAVLSSLITNTVRDILYINNNGRIAQKVVEISNLIDEHCFYDIDKEKMSDYAASGLTLAVDDMYTNYFPKSEFNLFKNDLSTSYYCVGILVSADEIKDKLVILEVNENEPADKAGLKPGDYIVAVDGIYYTAKDMNKVVSLIRGDDLEEKEGTTVNVTVERNGELKEFTITRELYVFDSVLKKMIDENIGYINILSFDFSNTNIEDAIDTYDEFVKAISDLKNSGMKSLIIDLRDNAGGSLDVAVKIADELLPEGVVTYTLTKTGQREDYLSKEGELDIPIVVLTNGNSASASEVLVGALKDYDKAKIVGTKTFGKGIVQTLYPLSDGSGLSLTTAKYYTPNGVCIHDIGIEPDYVVELDENIDNQLEKAINLLK